MLGLICVLLITACHRKSHVEAVDAGQRTTMSKDTADYRSQGYVIATIRNQSGKLDGCGWVIELEGDKWLEPINLDEVYRVDAKNIWLKYTPVRDGQMASICMIGEMVTVDDIKER